MDNFSANSVLDRFQIAIGVSSDSALSKALGANRATLGNLRSRYSIPYSICVSYAINNDISLNWLLAGQGEMTLNKSKRMEEASNGDRSILIKLFDSLNTDQQQETLAYLTDKNRLNSMEKIIEYLQRKISESL